MSKQNAKKSAAKHAAAKPAPKGTKPAAAPARKLAVVKVTKVSTQDALRTVLESAGTTGATLQEICEATGLSRTAANSSLWALGPTGKREVGHTNQRGYWVLSSLLAPAKRAVSLTPKGGRPNSQGLIHNGEGGFNEVEVPAPVKPAVKKGKAKPSPIAGKKPPVKPAVKKGGKK
jgi:hypothetical protein